MNIYQSLSLTGKDFRAYLENHDLKNLKIHIDIQENKQRGEVFKPISNNFIIVCCQPHLQSHIYGYTHLIYDFDNKTRFRINASTSKENNQIQIVPEQTEYFMSEFNSIEFIDTLLLNETEDEIHFWGSKLGIISTLTTINFSVKWNIYRESRQEWLKEYFPVKGLSDNFENSLDLFSDICSYDKEFLLQLSNYKINLIFKGLANLNRISKIFNSIRPEKLPRNNIERAKEQKNFIDSHETLIIETEDSLQNIHLFLNMLKVTSKGNKSRTHSTHLKDGAYSYVIGQAIDFVISPIIRWFSPIIGWFSPIIGWVRDGWQFIVQLFGRIKFWLFF